MDHTSQKKQNNDSVDLDDLLPQVGEFGKYQKLMIWLVCLPACFPCGFGAFNQLFMANVPPHWCKVPELLNFTVDLRKQIAIPRHNDSYSSCTMYSVNWTNLLEMYNDAPEAMQPNLSWPVEKCTWGYEYDKSNVLSSIVIDYDLVCEKDIYPSLALAGLNLGGPTGVYLFGFLNDKIGRKKAFFACLSTLIVGNLLTASAQNFWWWASSRVVVGFTIPAVYQIPFIISLELVGPNYRSFITVLTCLFYTMGLMMLAGIAYLIRDWVYLTLATSVPFFLYYAYWFFLPESPRWLLSKGRFEEASEILETLASVNGKEIPPSFKQQLKQHTLYKRSKSEEELMRRSPGLMDLCRTPNMRLKTVLITFNWFITGMVYVGLSYYGPSLGSNQYLSFFLSSVVEIPSYIICWFIMDKWGRRWPLCLSMIISGISCIGTILVPADDVYMTLTLYLISKSTISASFLIIYPFAGELYPTQLRGIGIGASAYIAGLGLVVIPFITYLGSEVLSLPLMIMGILSVIGGLSGLRLPETLHYRLPQTVEEGEEFGKDFTMEDYCRCLPVRPQLSSATSSYENLELGPMLSDETDDGEASPALSRMSMRKLARQSSIMDTQKSTDGTIQILYWF